MTRATVLLADDHVLFAQGVEQLLREHFEVVGAVLDGAQLINEADRLRPDVVLLDLSMPGGGGLEALRRLKGRKLPCKAMVLTMHADARLAAEAIRAGAAGFVLKRSSGDELVQAIDTVLRGHTYLTPDLTRDVLTLLSSPADGEVRLTPRQRQVLDLVVEGRRMKEIAQVLKLSPRTVETIKYEMMETLGVHSTAELVRHALQHHLVTVDTPGFPLD